MIISVIKSIVLKKILGLFGAAGFLLTFQACYGTPQNYYSVQGNINDDDSGIGISGMKVNVISSTDNSSATTDESGKFWSGIIIDDNIYKLEIRDIDGEENGLYADFDTILKISKDPVNISLKKE